MENHDGISDYEKSRTTNIRENVIRLDAAFSTEFIEKHSMNLRAWMIYILLQDIQGNVEWHESFEQFQKQGQTSKWFDKAKLLRPNRRRNQAISTIMPHQYVSGDAITFCLKAVKFKPPKGTYVYDILMSAATESQLWTSLWRSKRKTKEIKIDTIILPINVHNIHWYVAFVRIGKNEIKLNIRNNIGIRNKLAEQKLLNIAKKYQDRITIQNDQKNMETVEEHLYSMETQSKEATFDDFIKFYYGRKNHDNITTHFNDKKDKIGNQMSIIEGKSSEYTQVSPNREMYLHRTRQTKTKSHCVITASSKYDDISSKEDTEEEVIYSEGEPFDGYLYPNNTWDSDDSMYEDEYLVKSG